MATQEPPAVLRDVPEVAVEPTASARHYQLLFDTMLQGVVYQDPEGKIISMNPAAERILGKTWAEFIGQTSVSVEHHTVREDGSPFPGLEHPSMVALRTGREVRDVVMGVFNPREDDYRWITISAVPLFQPGEATPYQVYTVFEDITERRRAQEALRLQLHVTNTPLALVQWDAAWRVTSFSVRAEALFGWSAAEVIGKRIDEIPWVPEEDWPSVRAVMRGMSTGSRTTSMNAGRNVRKNGSIIHCEWYNSALHDADGKLVSVLSLVLDVTERKRAEEALRASEEKLRLAQEAADIGSWDWNLVTGEIVMSGRCRELFGHAPETVLTHDVYLAAIHPEDLDRNERAANDALAKRTDYDIELRVPLPDGTVRWVAARGRGVYDAAGMPVRLTGMTLDITARKRAEEALRDQFALEDRLARVAASVPGLICSYRLRPDGTACLPFSTPAAEDMFGLSQEVLANEIAPLMANVHPDDVRNLNERIEESARTMSRFHDEFRYLHPKKGLRWIEVWSVPKAESDGSILWHGYVMDATDRKRAEETLRESDRRKSEFLAVLSHELRNPLAPIRNCIYLLDRAGPGSEQAARAKDVIQRQTDHLARLVDDLLDVTRISRGKIELERARIDLREVVRRTCDDHRTLFDGRRIELRVEISGPVWIEADATRIAQVVGNLLQNAAKFSREGGTVTASIGTVDGQAEIRVRDDGMGVAPDLLPHVFEPFVQAAGGLARTKGGLGLGLALVKGLVELHGGSVRAFSEGAGRGSEFVVTLALAPAAPPSVSRPVATVSTRPVDVLVIEDNVDAAQTIAQVLEIEGHRVHIATDGLSGIAKARELRPDVILCDIGLPDVDGYEVARELRADEALRSTRLIALSGYAQPEDKERAREAGFEAHLAKPAPLDELNELVARTRSNHRVL